jgi:hypothetical protein
MLKRNLKRPEWCPQIIKNCIFIICTGVYKVPYAGGGEEYQVGEWKLKGKEGFWESNNPPSPPCNMKLRKRGIIGNYIHVCI